MTSSGVATGCGRPAPTSSALRVAIANAPEALDPRFATSATAMRLSQLVAPPLCVVGDDARAHLVLAESITRTGDLAVEATLRPDLRFPDGAPVTSADVAFTFTSVLDPATRSPLRGRLLDLEAVTVVDDRTVRFDLNDKAVPFIVDVVCAFGVVEAAVCADLDACRFFPKGAGAYEVGAVDVDRFQFTRRTAQSDLSLRVMRDGNARLLAAVAGDVDVVAGDVAAWDLDRLPPSLTVLSKPGLGYSYLGLNARRLSDDERNAIARAIDVDGLLHGRLRDRGARASGLLPPGHWAKDEALTPVGVDVDEARRLLAGKRLQLRLLVTPDRLRRSVALALREQLAVVGVDVELVVRDWSVVYEELKAGRFDLVLAKWTPVAEPDLLRQVFHSSAIPTPDKAGGNRGGFVDADIDGWLDAARNTFDEAERKRLYGLVERRAQDRMALVPLWFEDEVMLLGPRATGLEISRTGSFLPLANVAVTP